MKNNVLLKALGFIQGLCKKIMCVKLVIAVKKKMETGGTEEKCAK